jgi:hypothetical protein
MNVMSRFLSKFEMSRVISPNWDFSRKVAAESFHNRRW